MSNSSSLLPGVSHFISLNQAIEMTQRYRDEKGPVLAPDMRDRKILPICETFNREAFDSLLAQDGCVGIRLYFSMDDELKVQIIAVGVNASKEDMLPSGSGETSMTSATTDVIVEDGQRCPDDCPPPSPLNS